MKMMTLTTLTLALALAACGSTPSSGTDNGSATPTETAAATAPAATAQSAQSAQTDTPSTKHKNGITAKNAGDATGKITLNGTIPNANAGTVILYVMEGRNKSELARTALDGGSFEFKRIEISRGVYTLALNDDKNATEILLNPDESDVTLEFKTNRLSAAKTSPNSPENTGYWAYQTAETQNRNAIRGLRKSLADAGAFRCFGHIIGHFFGLERVR